jgi:hypothetical protein
VTSNFLVGQQDKLAQSTGDIAQGLIQVYKSLGGGWQIRCEPGPEVMQINGPVQVPAPQSLPGNEVTSIPATMNGSSPQPPNRTATLSQPTNR